MNLDSIRQQLKDNRLLNKLGNLDNSDREIWYRKASDNNENEFIDAFVVMTRAESGTIDLSVSRTCQAKSLRPYQVAFYLAMMDIN